MNFVDRIFVGELTNTIMCEECEHVSTGDSITLKKQPKSPYYISLHFFYFISFYLFFLKKGLSKENPL